MAPQRRLAPVSYSGTGRYSGRCGRNLHRDLGRWGGAQPYVAAYLVAMGLYILYRAYRQAQPIDAHSPALEAPLGAVGGFADAIGGGGWGPVVTTGLIGTGGAPRQMIGTVNTVEFFLTVAVSVAFLVALVTGHGSEAGGVVSHLWAIAGLIVGGVIAASLAGYATRILPQRALMALVGVLIAALSVYQTLRLF